MAASRVPGVDSTPAVMAVSIHPGPRAFTRTPPGARSTAASLVKRHTPALDTP